MTTYLSLSLPLPFLFYLKNIDSFCFNSEGSLSVIEEGTAKERKYLFFTDVLLIGKQNKKKYIIKHIIPISETSVKIIEQGISFFIRLIFYFIFIFISFILGKCVFCLELFTPKTEIIISFESEKLKDDFYQLCISNKMMKRF